MSDDTANIFAYVTLRPCGCACQAATPEHVEELLREDSFRDVMKIGYAFKGVSEEEYRALPWQCPTCKEPAE